MKTITLPEKRIKELKEFYNPRKADYIASILSESSARNGEPVSSPEQNV